MATTIKLKQLELTTSGYMIKANGSGIGAWVNPNTIALSSFNNDLNTGLVVGTSTITSGTNTRILYNNSGVLGEYLVTGTGTTAVLSTSPTFTTDITTPLIIGGTAVGSALTLKGTSGTGTSTVASIVGTVGTNGGTTAFQIYNSGNFNIGNASNTTPRLLRIGQDTAFIDIGSYTLATSVGAIYFNATTPSGTNYAFAGSSTFSQLNAPTTNVILSVANLSKATFAVNQNLFQTAAATSGVLISHQFTNPNNTGLTAGQNVPFFKVIGGTQTFAAGAHSLQYFNHLSFNSIAFASASTATHVANFRSDAPLAGANATATNLYAIDCGGHMFIANSVGVPSNNPTSGGILYVEAGALKYRGSSGTVTTLGAA